VRAKDAKRPMKIKNALLTVLGFVLLFFAFVGALLPVVPATPFAVAAFSCFYFSPKLRKKLLQMPLLRELLQNYQNRAGLSNKTVLLSFLYIWTGLSVSVALIKIVWVRLMLCAIGIVLTVHILYMTGAKKPARKD